MGRKLFAKIMGEGEIYGMRGVSAAKLWAKGYLAKFSICACHPEMARASLRRGIGFGGASGKRQASTKHGHEDTGDEVGVESREIMGEEITGEIKHVRN